MAASLLSLQRTAGNAVVTALLRRYARPRAAHLSAAVDRPLRRKIDRPLQRKVADKTAAVQPVAVPATAAAPAVQRQEEGSLGERISAAAGGGRPLEQGVQRRLEAGLGADLSGVRVHADGEADHLSRAVQAVAFTTGSHMFFRAGTYNPSTPQGLHLVAHEAAHTVQQARGPVSGRPWPGGVSVSDPGDRFERAAETAARQVTAAAQPVQRTTASGVVTPSKPMYIQRWNLQAPGSIPWGNTTDIRTLKSGQAVFFFEDNNNDTIVVKGEDAPIGLTTLVAELHTEIHGTPSVFTRDVTGDKGQILMKLGQTTLTSGESWEALGTRLAQEELAGGRQGGWQSATKASLAARSHKARAFQVQQLGGKPKVHAMTVAPGETVGTLSKSAQGKGGYESHRNLLANKDYLYKMGMVTAADLFLENADRVEGANFGNWFIDANQAVTLIDHLDAAGQSMWKLYMTDEDNREAYGRCLMMLASNQLNQTAKTCIGSLERGIRDKGDTTVSAWLGGASQGGGTRKEFAISQFRDGLSAGRTRIIKMYAAKKWESTEDRRAAKAGKYRSKDEAKKQFKADTASGDVAPATADYWTTIKVRAKWLQAH
jgi:hypothetical protein